MTQDIKLQDVSLFSSQTSTSREKSHEALAASIQQLEEMLEAVVTVDAKPSGAASSKGMDEFLGEMRSVLLKDPTNFMGVIKMIAPHVKATGVGIDAQIDEVLRLFTLYQESTKGLSAGGFNRDFEKHLEPSFAYGAEAKHSLDGLLEGLRPTFEKLEKSDPKHLQQLLDRVVPALAKIAFHNPKNAKSVLGSLKKNLSKEHLESVVRNYTTTQPSAVPGKEDSLAQSMLYLQLFQVALSQNQANQDTIDAKIAQAAITAAQNNQQNVAKEIQKANEEAEKAAHRPWWETFVEVFVAVVSVVVAALTAGTGAALVAAAVGMFMATPAFNDTVQVIAKAISAVLVKVYEDEGMSSEDAHMKANAVADLIAKAIVIVVVMAVSCGVGGIAAASDGVTDAAVETATEEVVETATDEAAESATGSASKYTYSFKTGAKLAGFEGVSLFSSTGMPMDCMMTNPEWAKEHQKLVEGLNIMATLIGMILTFVAGAKTFSGAGTGTTMLERLPSAFKAIIPLQYLAQAGQGVTEGVLAIKRAGYLRNQASITRDIGALEAALSEYLSGVDFVSDARKTNDTTAIGITKGIAEEMSTLGEASGAVWNVTRRAVAS